MKWILWIFVVLAGFLILITLIGWLLPKDHVATRQGRYRQTLQCREEALLIPQIVEQRQRLSSVHLRDGRLALEPRRVPHLQ